MDRRMLCVGVLACVLALGASVRAQEAQEKLVARVNGRGIPLSDYEDALLKAVGTEVTEQKIYEAIVQAEMAGRGLLVPDERIEERIRVLKRQHEELTGGQISFEESLRRNQLQDPARLRERIRIELGAELMLRKDKRLMDVETISPGDRGEWYRALRRGVDVTTRDLPEWVFVRIQWPGGKALDISRREVLEAIHGILSEDRKRMMQGQLIEEELIRQLAEERGVEVGGGDIIRRLREMKEEFELANPGKRFEEWMAAQGASVLDPLANPRARYELLLRKMVEPTVSQEDVREYFEENRDLLSGKRVLAAHILASTIDLRTGTPKDASGVEAAEERIREVAERIKAGEEFATLAARYSDDPQSRAKGGVVGPITKDMPIPREFLEVAFSLGRDEVSEPFRTQLGWHIVKVIDIQVARELDFSEEAFREVVRGMLVGQEMQTYLRGELGKADIEVMALP